MARFLLEAGKVLLLNLKLDTEVSLSTLIQSYGVGAAVLDYFITLKSRSKLAAGTV